MARSSVVQRGEHLPPKRPLRDQQRAEQAGRIRVPVRARIHGRRISVRAAYRATCLAVIVQPRQL